MLSRGCHKVVTRLQHTMQQCGYSVATTLAADLDYHTCVTLLNTHLTFSYRSQRL